MKRILLIVAAVLVVLILVPVGLVASVFIGAPSIPDGKELPGGARLLKDGFTSVAVIPLGGRDLALIDAGQDKEGKAILAELGRRGGTPADVKAIFLTHGHPDHTGAWRVFPNAQVMALKAEADLLDGRTATTSPMSHLMGSHPPPVKVARALSDGETVTVGEKQIQVFAIPGHTAGSAAYLVDGVLYLGDAVQATKSGKLKASVWALSDDQEQDRASLKALAQRLLPQASAIKLLVTSHNGVLEGFGPLEHFDT